MKRDVVKGILHSHISIKPFTSWHIGGDAEKLYWPLNLADLQTFLKTVSPVEPLHWLGLGSNILVSDAGIAGTVIITQGVLKELTLISAGRIRAEAGLSCAQVARFAAKNDLIGGEFLAGIPGTVGGALFMNAGAFGGETWEKVTQVETLDRQGKIRLRSKSEFEWGYRYTRGLAENEWFSAAYFDFMPGDGKQGLEKIRALLERRAETQPTGEPSCGSTFRNPSGDYAARLIEACGLKGCRIGDIEVSSKHANFLINLDQATAADTLKLVYHIQKEVQEKFAIELHPEFKWLGRSA